MGVKSFITDNEGKKYYDPKALVRLESRLIIEQQRLSLKTKGSNNYNKQRIKVARVHERIEAIRNNYLHQISTKIINENQIIIVEDLDIKGMFQNKKLSKRLSDVSIRRFISMLEYMSMFTRNSCILLLTVKNIIQVTII